MDLFITGLLKFLIGLVGILATLIFLVLSLFKKIRKGQLQNAGVTFLTSMVLILLITGLEFLMHPSNKRLDQLVLTGHREAPLGAYWLGVYNDGTWELGQSSREIVFSGHYTISGDTLRLKTRYGTAFGNGATSTDLVIHNDDLLEVKNTGIKALKIGVNKLGNE